MTSPAEAKQPSPEALSLASEIVAAYAGNNKLKAEDLPVLLTTVYGALCELGSGARGPREPAAPVSKSVTPDYIICLEDGKKLKMLKRYLRTHFGLSPEEYRRKWNLPADYPMTAPNYAKTRSQLAKHIGLGTSQTSAKRRSRKTAAAKSARRKA